MNILNRCFAIASLLMFTLSQNAINPIAANADPINTDRAFRISPADYKYLVVDAYGDNLPASKTYTHLYNSTSTLKTSQMKAVFQPQYNNSYEIHMQNDMGLCFGPDVTSRSQMRDGVAAVVKRDCANVLNHLLEGERLRVNNTNFCLDIPRGNIVQGQRLHYWTCNGSNAQRLNLTKPDNDGLKAVNGACFRNANRGLYQGWCDYKMPAGATKITWTGGAYATLVLSYPDVTQSNGVNTPGYSFNKYLNPDEGSIQIPTGIAKYRIAPWNEKQTTQFSITIPQ